MKIQLFWRYFQIDINIFLIFFPLELFFQLLIHLKNQTHFCCVENVVFLVHLWLWEKSGFPMSSPPLTKFIISHLMRQQVNCWEWASESPRSYQTAFFPTYSGKVLEIGEMKLRGEKQCQPRTTNRGPFIESYLQSGLLPVGHWPTIGDKVSTQSLATLEACAVSTQPYAPRWK